MNTQFLQTLTLEIFGASHAECIGVKMGGLPAGEVIDLDALYRFLARRAPGNNPFGTARREADLPIFRSGLTLSADGKTAVTDGGELFAVIENHDARSADYPPMDVPRPSHADYTAFVKYGGDVDLRGGGKYSGRMTAPLCIAGGIALQILARRGIFIGAHIARLGGIADTPFDPCAVTVSDFRRACYDGETARPLPVMSDSARAEMTALLGKVRAAGDSVGGVIECAVLGLPVGLGDHPFFGLENRISHVAFAVPAVKGIEFGAGFAAAEMFGSQCNDPFRTDGERIFTATNHSGGIQGGMSNGMPLIFRVAVKPTPSIALEQQSVSLSRMENTTITVGGRHDPCICPRAVPVIEAVAAIAALDAMAMINEK